LPRKGFTNLPAPIEMVAVIREIVEAENPVYTSISDFVREALREKIERYELSTKNRKHRRTQLRHNDNVSL